MSLRIEGNQAYASRDFDKAIALYTEALKQGRDPAALANRAACYIQLRNWNNARQDARDALTMSPPPPLRMKLLYRLAVSAAEVGEDPAPYIKQGLEIDPANVELVRLSKITFVPVQTAEILPHRYSVKPQTAEGPHPVPQNIAAPDAPQPQDMNRAQLNTFLAPQLPLTYNGVINACREHSPRAYDWWYSLDPAQLVQAHSRVGIEPSTLEYLREMVLVRGGEQGQRLLDASTKCNGYDMADMMVL